MVIPWICVGYRWVKNPAGGWLMKYHKGLASDFNFWSNKDFINELHESLFDSSVPTGSSTGIYLEELGESVE